MRDMSELKPLSTKHALFVDEYLKCLNATQAYLVAYPKAKKESARAAASALLTNLNVKTEIENRVKASHMSADEALRLQAEIARGDITEFITGYGNIDLDKLRDSGKGRLVKKIRTRTITKIGKTDKDEDTEIVDTELELYPADAAQERILRMHGKIKDPSTLVFNVRLTDE